MNLDASRKSRKIKRSIKADRPKIVGLSILTCILAPLPYAGTWAALATGLLAFWIVGRSFLTVHQFEMEMEDAGLSDLAVQKHMPPYQPIIVNAGLCLAAMFAAAIVASKLAGNVRELLGVIS